MTHAIKQCVLETERFFELIFYTRIDVIAKLNFVNVVNFGSVDRFTVIKLLEERPLF